MAEVTCADNCVFSFVPLVYMSVFVPVSFCCLFVLISYHNSFWFFENFTSCNLIPLTSEFLHVCPSPPAVCPLKEHLPKLIKNKINTKHLPLSFQHLFIHPSGTRSCFGGHTVYCFVQSAPSAKCSLQWVIGLSQGLWHTIITGQKQYFIDYF